MVTALPEGEAFVKQRRFKLAVALEVADRGGGEDFTAGNTAGGGGAEGVGLATAGGEAVGGEGGVGGGGQIGRGTPRAIASCCSCRRVGSNAS